MNLGISVLSDNCIPCRAFRYAVIPVLGAVGMFACDLDKPMRDSYGEPCGYREMHLDGSNTLEAAGGPVTVDTRSRRKVSDDFLSLGDMSAPQMNVVTIIIRRVCPPFLT